MKTITLSNRKTALVDDADFDFLNYFVWGDTEGYACNRKLGYMHHFVLPFQVGFVVHHKDTNRLNNQRENLELVTHSLNIQMAKKWKTNTSGYRGVSFVTHMRDRCWQAQIKIRNKAIHLGVYTTPQEAALMYNKAALEHFGPSAMVNAL